MARSVSAGSSAVRRLAAAAYLHENIEINEMFHITWRQHVLLCLMAGHQHHREKKQQLEEAMMSYLATICFAAAATRVGIDILPWLQALSDDFGQMA